MPSSGVAMVLLAVVGLLVGGGFMVLWFVQRAEVARARALSTSMAQRAEELAAAVKALQARLHQATEAHRALHEEARGKLALAAQRIAEWKAMYERLARWENAQSLHIEERRMQGELRALERTAEALRNVIKGYGTQYVVPPQSALDDLAREAAHTDAGQRLKDARAHSRALARRRLAATCDYTDETRAAQAADFVLDAFNGKVEAVIESVRSDNIGTLMQKVRDAFILVNANGAPFRNARITPEYLDARMEEVRWAALVQRIKADQREEQRRLKEQMREEAKVQREFERAEREARKQEAALAQERARIEVAREEAMLEERARQEARLREELSTVAEEQRAAIEITLRAQFERELAQASSQYTERIAESDARIRELEARRQRAMSMAQQTKAGTVYVISNIGAFGEGIYKIGQTRRLDPMERIWELGDASVPFDFDVHALIPSDNAPGIEGRLHEKFVLNQVNKMNWRKEFFRTDLASIRAAVEELALPTEWTMEAAAQQYRETAALEAQMATDAHLQARWVAEQLGHDFSAPALPRDGGEGGESGDGGEGETDGGAGHGGAGGDGADGADADGR